MYIYLWNISIYALDLIIFVFINLCSVFFVYIYPKLYKFIFLYILRIWEIF